MIMGFPYFHHCNTSLADAQKASFIHLFFFFNLWTSREKEEEETKRKISQWTGVMEKEDHLNWLKTLRTAQDEQTQFLMLSSISHIMSEWLLLICFYAYIYSYDECMHSHDDYVYKIAKYCTTWKSLDKNLLYHVHCNHI